MDEKKNLTPNAIEDDNLEGVSGGTGGSDNLEALSRVFGGMTKVANSLNRRTSSSSSKHSHDYIGKHRH